MYVCQVERSCGVAILRSSRLTALVLPKYSHVVTVPAVKEANVVRSHNYNVTDFQLAPMVNKVKDVVLVHVTLQVPTTNGVTITSDKAQAELLPQECRSVPTLPTVHVVYVEAFAQDSVLELCV
jgi:hypothetical protein